MKYLRTLSLFAALTVPLVLLHCGSPEGTTGACSDAFIKTDKDYGTDQLGIYTTRDPDFANGSYELGQGDCAGLASSIDVTVAEDGNSVAISSGGEDIVGVWSDDDKSFSVFEAPGRTCLLALTKDAAHCVKGATYFCDSSCSSAYVGQ